MVDACTVHRPGGVYTDPNGVVAPSLTLVYTGAAKVQQTISQASAPEAGGHQYTVQEARVDFPVPAGPFLVGDVVTVTSSDLDPQLTGRKFRVIELFHKSYATAQRTRVEEVVS
jgi:hypothetical protein